jgi:hypothetical protein
MLCHNYMPVVRESNYTPVVRESFGLEASRVMLVKE